ncbi:hypothetical protein ACPTKC_29675, partial [Pseudomonas aeruginosa]
PPSCGRAPAGGLTRTPPTRRGPETGVVRDSDDIKVIQEEINGPLLPVFPYERLEDALSYLNQRPRPLAQYYFAFDKAQQQA